MTFTNGAVYIDGEYVGTASEGIEITSFEPDMGAIEDYVKDNFKISLDSTGKFTGTVNINKIILLKLIGLWYWAMDNCPNKRIVHLMKYGKNPRVKLKNFRRACWVIDSYLK
jgi:hypothetical protein